MKAQVGPASKDCKSKDDLDKLLAKPEVVVVCYSKDAQDVFMKVANAMRETVAFGHTEAGDKEGIVLHRPKVSLFLNPNLIAIKLYIFKYTVQKWQRELLYRFDQLKLEF